MEENEEKEGNFFVGLFWGTIISVPLWIAIIGWYKLLFR